MTFGKDTIYSVRMLLNGIGIDPDELSFANDVERFDFVDEITPRLLTWFYNRFYDDVDVEKLRMCFIHGLRYLCGGAPA